VSLKTRCCHCTTAVPLGIPRVHPQVVSVDLCAVASFDTILSVTCATVRFAECHCTTAVPLGIPRVHPQVVSVDLCAVASFDTILSVTVCHSKVR